MDTIFDEPIPLEIKRKLIKPLAPQIPSIQKHIDIKTKKSYQKQLKHEKKSTAKQLKKTRYESKKERVNIPVEIQPQERIQRRSEERIKRRAQRRTQPSFRITINPALENNVIEVSYHNLTTTNPKFIDEVVKDLVHKIINKFNQIGKFRLQFRGEILVHRGMEVDNTMNWYHTNTITNINNITNIEQLVRSEILRLYQKLEEAGLEGSDWL
ncbi:MAG: hypothetical protein ACM31H_05330 [Nitrososphaerales archaeon]